MKNAKEHLLVYLGGTIGMRKNAAGANAPGRIDGLLDNIRSAETFEVRSLGRIVDSSQLDFSLFNQLLKLLEREYACYEGFLIVGGTDTMAYLQSLLKWHIIGLGKPIILTGAMNTPEEDEREGAENLLFAMEMLKEHKNQGIVALALNHKLIRSAGKKFDATDRSPFIGSGTSALEEMRTERERKATVIRFLEMKKHRLELITLQPLLAIPLDAPLEDGLLLAVYGQGTVLEDPELRQRVRRYKEAGRPVVVISQVPYNKLDPGQYEAGGLLLEEGLTLGAGSFLEEGVGCLSYLINKAPEDF